VLGAVGCDKVMWMVVTVYLVVLLLDVAGYVCSLMVHLSSSVGCD
jgi:hypothetical protein